MIEYTTTIFKFKEQGEKTGWTYIEVPFDIAQQLKPNFKKSFRVKGFLDKHQIEKTALLPMGGGLYILPLNTTLKKGIGKREGATVEVKLEIDERELKLNSQLMECLNDETEALAFFNSLPKSHQHYYSKWVESAKTEITKTKRIAICVNAMCKRHGFSEMMRSYKNHNMKGTQ